MPSTGHRCPARRASTNRTLLLLRRRRSWPREAALALGVSAADYDRMIDPKTMVGNPHRDLGLDC
jgi:hypothetical protein